MHIEIAGHHVELTEDTRALVTERAEHLLHIFDGLTSVHVTLQAEKERRVAEFVANVVHGAPIVAKVTDESLDAAINLAAEKVAAQLRKHKEKVRDHRAGKPEDVPPTPPAPEEAPE